MLGGSAAFNPSLNSGSRNRLSPTSRCKRVASIAHCTRFAHGDGFSKVILGSLISPPFVRLRQPVSGIRGN